MKIINATLVAAAMLVGGIASASFNTNEFNGLAMTLAAKTAEAIHTDGMNMKPGDTLAFDMNMGGFMKGTMKMSVKSASNTEAVITQDIAIMGQNQSCDSTLDLTNGKIKSVVCNGQAQQVPEGSQKVIDSHEDNVTVPAGTFDCLYIKAQDDKGQTIEEWVNPTKLPIGGMLKANMPSQMGTIALALTSFARGH